MFCQNKVIWTSSKYVEQPMFRKKLWKNAWPPTFDSRRKTNIEEDKYGCISQ